MKQVKLYINGAYLSNPGACGVGVVLVNNKQVSTFSAGYKHTTNNRMELLSVIYALELLDESCNVTVYFNGQYVQHGVLIWIKTWLQNNWNRGTVKNQDLWKKFIDLTSKHTIKWNWVEGRLGHKYHQKCDQLAKQGALEASLEDVGYTNEKKS